MGSRGWVFQVLHLRFFGKHEGWGGGGGVGNGGGQDRGGAASASGLVQDRLRADT